MEAPNYFIGFPLSDGWVARAIEGIPPGLRTFRGEDIHITIAFLGACGEERALRAWYALAGDDGAPRGDLGPAFSLELGGVEPFGPPHAPSALSIVPQPLENPARDFLARHRDATLEAAGLRSEGRPPRPHATVARIPRGASDELRAAALRWAAQVPALGERVTIDEIALFTWTENRAEQLYRIIARRPLGA